MLRYCCASVAKTASISRLVLALKTRSCEPENACRSLHFSGVGEGKLPDYVGLTSRAMAVALGTTSCNISSRFDAGYLGIQGRYAGDIATGPVEARDETDRHGIEAGVEDKIGIVVVAALAASAEAVPLVAITATFR